MLLTNVVRMLARYQKSPQRCNVEGFFFCPWGYFLQLFSQYSNKAVRILTNNGRKNAVRMNSATVSPPFNKIRGLVYHIRILLTLSNAPKSSVFAFNSRLVLFTLPTKNKRKQGYSRKSTHDINQSKPLIACLLM